MEKHCNLCGAEMVLDKTFPGKSNKIKRRERYKCTDPTCLHEETIQPGNEEHWNQRELDFRQEFKLQAQRAKYC